MLNLLAVLQKDRFKPRFYIVAATDNMSLQKALLLENPLASEVLFCKLVSTLYKYLLSNELCFFPHVNAIIIVVYRLWGWGVQY